MMQALNRTSGCRLRPGRVSAGAAGAAATRSRAAVSTQSYRSCDAVIVVQGDVLEKEGTIWMTRPLESPAW